MPRTPLMFSARRARLSAPVPRDSPPEYDHAVGHGHVSMLPAEGHDLRDRNASRSSCLIQLSPCEAATKRDLSGGGKGPHQIRAADDPHHLSVRAATGTRLIRLRSSRPAISATGVLSVTVVTFLVMTSVTWTE